jgi:hypothetical protein
MLHYPLITAIFSEIYVALSECPKGIFPIFILIGVQNLNLIQALHRRLAFYFYFL